MSDQFLIYDQAMMTWLNALLPPLLPSVTTRMLMATPKRAFVDVFTGKVVSNDIMTLPRISITRGPEAIDSKRFNSNRLRYLGWTSTVLHSSKRSAKFPTPIVLPYTIDLWTKYVSEMNLWVARVLSTLAQTFVYLTSSFGTVYGNKMYPVFLASDLVDNSELEPAGDDRAIRRSIPLRVECWLFDEAFVSAPVVKRFHLEYRDYDDESLYDDYFLPPEDVVGVGTGAQVHYTATLERIPVLDDSFVLQTICSGATVIVQDDTSGNLVIDNVTVGTIDYVTGAIDITFPVAPDLGVNLTVTYFMDLS